MQYVHKPVSSWNRKAVLNLNVTFLCCKVLPARVYALHKLQALVYDILPSGFSGGRCQKAMLGVCALQFPQPSHSLLCCTLTRIKAAGGKTRQIRSVLQVPPCHVRLGVKLFLPTNREPAVSVWSFKNWLSTRNHWSRSMTAQPLIYPLNHPFNRIRTPTHPNKH